MITVAPMRMSRPANHDHGHGPVAVGLPAGFGVAFESGTRFTEPGVLFGGSPPRLLRLNAAGMRALEELRRGPVGSAAAGRLARRLTDAGLAHPRPPALGQPAQVTLVIPVRDRTAGLDRCLAALGTGYPVIVVDDGSLDPAAVAAVCRARGATLKRRLVPGGPGPARNDGLAMVTTPLVAFLDSDCVTGPDWIARLAAHFADPMVGAAAPRVRPVTAANALGRYLAARAPADMGPAESRVAPLTRLSYVPTAALLARCAAIDGFDPDLRYGEDVDLVWRVIAAGWRVRYDPAAEVRHVEPDRWAAALARRYRYGTSAAPLARRHPGLVPPLIVQAWPAAAAAALLAGRPLTALSAYGAGVGQLARLLHGWGVPARGMLRPMAGSVQQAWLGAGRWSIQFTLPAVAAGIARPGGRTRRARIGRQLALASLLAGSPAAAWLRSRPRLDPLRFALAYLADEAAYGAGVYRGAAAERLAAPLLPRVAWRPLPKTPGAPATGRPGSGNPPPRQPAAPATGCPGSGNPPPRAIPTATISTAATPTAATPTAATPTAATPPPEE
jgi:mycofactocin system glycosyltransferase